MVTLNLSAGAVFSMGLVVGIIVGVVGLAAIALISNKTKK